MWDWLWKETPEQSSFLVQIVVFAAFTEHPKETQQPA